MKELKEKIWNKVHERSIRSSKYKHNKPFVDAKGYEWDAFKGLKCTRKDGKYDITYCSHLIGEGEKGVYIPINDKDTLKMLLRGLNRDDFKARYYLPLVVHMLDEIIKQQKEQIKELKARNERLSLKRGPITGYKEIKE